MRVVYLFTSGPPDDRFEIHLPVDRSHPEIPTLSELSFPASRFERELRDLFGIEPIGHPQARRLVLHQHWPDNWFPMRHDAGPPPTMAADTEQFPFVPVTGTGVYEIPVGPVHAGLIEPGHFRFWVVGETILRMKARLWFVHKGIERLLEGMTVTAGIDVAERISGDTAVGHTIAFCQAVEDARRVTVPEDAQVLRALLLELERVYNHVSDLGALCNDVGFGLANAWALSLREELLQLNRAVTGHRLLRGGVVPGGAHVQRLPTHEELDRIGRRFEELVELAGTNAFVMERFTGTASLDGSHRVIWAWSDRPRVPPVSPSTRGRPIRSWTSPACSLRLHMPGVTFWRGTRSGSTRYACRSCSWANCSGDRGPSMPMPPLGTPQSSCRVAAWESPKAGAGSSSTGSSWRMACSHA